MYKSSSKRTEKDGFTVHESKEVRAISKEGWH